MMNSFFGVGSELIAATYRTRSSGRKYGVETPEIKKRQDVPEPRAGAESWRLRPMTRFEPISAYHLRRARLSKR